MPCCPTSCPPIPTPFMIDGAYPQVDAPMYAIYDSDLKRYIAPVFLDNPGPCVNPAPGIVRVGAKTVHVFYARKAGSTNPIKNAYVCSPGLPTVQLQNCRPRACATSREQFERSKLAAIAVTAQNGTYCKSPMSSSELLQYQKAMNSVKDLYVINNCC